MRTSLRAAAVVLFTACAVLLCLCSPVFAQSIANSGSITGTVTDPSGAVVPGAMVYAFAEGLLVHATMQHTGFAFLHMELNVEGPTFAGDTIHVECEVLESRRSASRPNRGLVRTRNRVVQQDGRPVLTYTPLRMVKARTQA